MSKGLLIHSAAETMAFKPWMKRESYAGKTKPRTLVRGGVILVTILTLLAGITYIGTAGIRHRSSRGINTTYESKKATTTSEVKQTATPEAEKKNQPAREQAVLGSYEPITIIFYHYIRVNPDPLNKEGEYLSVTPDHFKQQMDYVAAHGYHAISLDEYAASLDKKFTLPTKPVIIAFDDGYSDAHNAAFPILRDRKLKGVSFIVTGFVGKPGYLTWQQIDEMKTSGVMTFGAHTLTHRNLVLIPKDEARNEIVESKRILQEKVGYPINWFAYPYGAVNGDVVKLVQEAGFRGALGTNKKTFFHQDRIFTILRTHINGTDTLEDFAAKLP